MFAKPKYWKDEAQTARFTECEARLPGQDVPWLAHRRKEAFARFEGTGFPTRQIESWKFTDVKNLLKLHDEDARPHQGDVCDVALPLDDLPAGPRLLLVNGRHHSALTSLPELAGAEIAPLQKELEKHAGHIEAYFGQLSARDDTHAFANLSMALAADGAVLRLEEEAELEQPLVIGHVHTGGKLAEQVLSRNLFILKAGSKATIVEYHLGVTDAVYASNTTTEIYLAPGAELTHIVVQAPSVKAAAISTRYIRQDAKSRYHGVVLNEGGVISRVESQFVLKGEEADANLHTVQLLNGSLHADSTSVVTHDTVNATSNQHCRMVLDGWAKGVWQGKTIVARDAQKTDAHQLNKNLILDRNAQADIKPELEIYADDVKCSHGATTGELDETALFYLMSRGINHDEAKRLLVEAFADNAIDEAAIDDEWKEVLRARVAAWMEAGRG